ncbi:MAG: phosphoribosyltransferase family protein [Patescibacteria group bacterium]
MIHYLKYNGVTESAPILADLLIDQLIDEDIPDDIIITVVPLHSKKYLERGFNQSEMLAKIVAKKLGLSYQCVLSRIRETESQVKLKGDKRRENLVDAFASVPRISIENKTIMIIDDVSTTGTTLEECARVLRASGARRVYGLVVARG